MKSPSERSHQLRAYLAVERERYLLWQMEGGEGDGSLDEALDALYRALKPEEWDFLNERGDIEDWFRREAHG
jgi:hypothetical protein